MSAPMPSSPRRDTPAAGSRLRARRRRNAALGRAARHQGTRRRRDQRSPWTPRDHPGHRGGNRVGHVAPAGGPAAGSGDVTGLRGTGRVGLAGPGTPYRAPGPGRIAALACVKTRRPAMHAGAFGPRTPLNNADRGYRVLARSLRSGQRQRSGYRLARAWRRPHWAWRRPGRGRAAVPAGAWAGCWPVRPVSRHRRGGSVRAGAGCAG